MFSLISFLCLPLAFIVFVVQLSSCKTISYRLLNLNYCMDGRFLSSEEQAVHYPLITSWHHQLARNLFCLVAFCLPTNFPFAEPPGHGWLPVWQQHIMTHAWAGIEKRQGNLSSNLSPATQSNVLGAFTAHSAQKLWAPCNPVCFRGMLSCFALI